MIGALRRKGIPLALYSDKHSIFLSSKRKLFLEDELAGQKQPLSTIRRTLADLGIIHIETLSPQAKGRTERLFVTLQDRRVIELRLQGVSILEEANRVCP